MQKMQCTDGMDMIMMGTVYGWSSLEVVGALAEEEEAVEVVGPQGADMDPHRGVLSTEW